MALPITITDAGRAEIIAAGNTGTNKVTITAVALGTGRYTPSKGQTTLQAEIKRLTSIAGKAVAADTIHVMAQDESSATYNVGEFGLISDKGTLIAVFSQLPAEGWILQKAAPSTLLLATDIILESLDTAAITFGDISFINPPATVDTPGVVQLEHSLTSNSNARALTAGMGKKLQDEKEPGYAVGTTAQYRRGDKTWRDFATDVRAAALTGLSTATATAVAATDTVLAALGKLQAQVTGLATSKLNANANAVSATKLQTARSIGGVAFDGTANINLPGVNAAGTQSTSGNAATATKLATPRAINGVNFDGSAAITIADGTKEPSYAAGTTAQYRRGDKTWRDFATDVRAAVLTGLSTATATAVAATDTVLAALGKLQAQITGLATSKLDANANAVSATKLQTARTIGGVAFDGTANINLPGVNAAGNQNTTGNAATATKLVTPRAINGVNFDGSAAITIADGTKEPSYAAGTTAQYRRGDKTWRDFATDVRAAVLTGLSTATATAVAAADTVLAALGKLQAQITGLAATKANLASPALTGTPTVPTAAVAANNTQAANTAWVKARIAELPDSPKNTWGIVGSSAWWKCGDTGLIVQFGVALEASTITDYRTFPVQFPNRCMAITATRNNEWHTNSDTGTVAYIASASQFAVVSGQFGSGNQISWIAIGF